MTSLRNPLHRMCGRGVDSVSKPYRFSKANHHQRFPSLRGVRRSLTGWIIFIEHIFYKRLIPEGLNETPPRFFRLSGAV